MQQIRIATADIEIAKRDKRKSYGLEAVGVIPVGTQFSYLPGIAKEFEPAYVDLGQYRSGHVNAEVAERIEANSRLKLEEEFTVKDMLDMHDKTPAEEVLEVMYKKGWVSRGDIYRAIEIANAEG